MKLAVRKISNRRKKCIQGFTLVEVVIVGAIIGIMFMLTTQSLFRGNKSASLDQVSSSLLTDLRQQQIRAMQGMILTQGTIVDYSIRFESDRYILYPGAAYDSVNPQNQVVLLDSSMRFTSIGVPGSSITFALGSGDVRGYTSGADAVVLTETATGNAWTIRVNEAGVVFISK